MTFEDPTLLARCIKSDCDAYRAGGTPLCAAHLREQEVSAGATSIVEPDVEARARAAGDKAVGVLQPVEDLYVGPDPDTMLPSVDTIVQRILPDPTDLEPHWDGHQWVLRAKRQRNVPAYAAKLGAIASLVRELMHELGIAEADPDD